MWDKDWLLMTLWPAYKKKNKTPGTWGIEEGMGWEERVGSGLRQAKVSSSIQIQSGLI